MTALVNAIARSRLGFTITIALCIALVGWVEGGMLP